MPSLASSTTDLDTRSASRHHHKALAEVLRGGSLRRREQPISPGLRWGGGTVLVGSVRTGGRPPARDCAGLAGKHVEDGVDDYLWALLVDVVT